MATLFRPSVAISFMAAPRPRLAQLIGHLVKEVAQGGLALMAGVIAVAVQVPCP